MSDTAEEKKFTKQEGVAATFEEDSIGDMALLELANHHWFKIFIILSIALSITETVLIAFPSTLTAQRIILGVSTLLFLVGYIATIVVMPNGTTLRKRASAALLPEVWIEVIALILGWVLIYADSSMAPIRCFRVFRFVWYSEFYRAKHGSPFYVITFFCHLVLQYLEKLGKELFTTTNSKGGVVVLGFFFFMAYVMGVILWLKTGNMAIPSPEGGTTGLVSECDTLLHCFLIMLRLTFFDGSGFDFVKSLMDVGSSGLVVLLIIYMCISALVLLNGLIGIFGGTFVAATEDDDDDDEDEEKDDEEKKGTIELKVKEVDVDVAATLDRIERLCLKLQGDIDQLKHR